MVNEREIAVDVACYQGISRLPDPSDELSELGFGNELCIFVSLLEGVVIGQRSKTKPPG